MDQTSFLQYLEFEKRFSPHTIQAYRKDLEQFLGFIEEQAELRRVEEIRHTHIRSWVVELLVQDLSPRTINRKLSTLKTFFRFLLKRQVITANPMRKVVSPKNGKRLPVYVPVTDLEHLFERVTFGDDYPGQRDRLLLQLLYETGMRRSELLNLRLGDIDRERRLLRVLGKGNKERLIPITGALLQNIDAYLLLRRTAFPDAHRPELLLTDSGEPLYPKLVYNIVHKYLSLVTTVEKRSPHVLRHSFATHLSDNGADLNAIKELLGHANLAATQIYTHNSIEKLRKVYQKAHPKAKSDQ